MAIDPGIPRVSEGCPESIAALDLSKPGLLEASAGTGKTYAIEHLILRLLIETPDLELPSILVLTFTDKATGELKDKIRARIAGRLAQGGLPREARGRLERAHLEFDRASIHTIHGFCQRVLRKYAFENHSLFRQDLHKNVGEALSQVLHEQMRSAWAPAGGEEGGMEAFRALAGALGLGARTQWRRRITDIAKDFNPERGDLLLPDPDPARVEALRAEMAACFDRLANLVPGLLPGQEPTHAFAQRYATLPFRSDTTRKKGLRVVIAALRACAACRPPAGPGERDAAVAAFFAEVEAINLMGIGKHGYRFLLPADGDGGEPWPDLEAFLAALDAAQGAATRIANEIASRSFLPRRKAILDLREEFRAWLRERGLITYDTMIEDVALALRAKPERAAMLRRDYRYCLVDEFQDTDPLQWEIFRTVFLEGGPGHPLYLIGDPKQAIYRFRGGDVYTYMEARKAVFALAREGKAQGLGLDTNYRSSAAMVAAYNAAFTHRSWFHAHAIDPADAAWRLPAEPDPLGYVPVKAGALASQAVHDATDSPKPIILKDFSGDGQADLKAVRRRAAHWIAGEILALMAAPDRLRIPDRHGSGIRPLAWGDLCVLVRKGKEKEYLERALTEAGIPVQAHRRAGLYQSDAAGQYLAVLESLEDPADTGRHACALLTRFFRAEGDPPPDRPPETPHPLFEDWIRLAARRRWQRLFHSLQYKSGLLYREGLRPDAARSIMDFTHIGQNLVQEAIRGNLDLAGLVQRLRDLRAADPGGDEDVDMHREASEGGKVSLMTMHVSKGLEFPVVFLASFSGNPQSPSYLKYRSGSRTVYHLDAKDPEARRAWQEESDGEDRRLFYVALTRARYKLYVPLLPAGSKRSDSGPLGGFAAEALRSAAALHPDLYHYAPPEDFARPPAPLPVLASPAAEPAEAAPEAGEGDPFEGYPTDDPLAEADFPRRRRRLASYSLLVRRAPGVATDAVEGRFDKEEPGAEPAAPGSEAQAEAREIPGNALPRGKDIGNLFHEILEDIDFAAVAPAESPEAMLAVGPVRDRIAQALEEHRVEDRWLPGIAAVIWNTLHAALPDPAGGPDFSLAHVAERRPELEFLFPYPAVPGPAGPDGYLWGFVDLVFRKDGRYYLLDWKSNHLPAYGRADLEASMRESRYDVQYMLYSLALDKWLRALLPDYDPARHFGGVYYLYLRGLEAGKGAAGVYCVRPDAADLREGYAETLAGIVAAAGAAGLSGRVDASLFVPDPDAPARKAGA